MSEAVLKLQGLVRNILHGTKDSELLQSYVRGDEDEDKEDKSLLPPIVGSSQVPPKIIVSPPKASPTEDVKKEDEKPKLESQSEEINGEGCAKEKPSSRPGTSKQKMSDLTKEVKMKKGRRRRKRRQEEIYTDKDRAAAVNMGSKDIKQSLVIKQKQDRSRLLQIPEEAEPGTFMALGNHEIRNNGDFKVALGFMNKALEINPRDKDALVARSRCFILLGEANRALQDAETALSIDKNFIQGIYQKAEALYYLGQFEHSLMYYHRGLKIRPELQKFRLGVQKAQEAIENTIGSNMSLAANLSSKSSRVGRGDEKSTSFQSLKTMATGMKAGKTLLGASLSSGDAISKTPSRERADTAETKKSTPNSLDVKKRPTTQCSVRKSPSATSTQRKPPKHLLGALNVDKEYFQNLLNNPDIKCLDKENTEIIAKAKEAIEYLNNRQEFWRQQLPPSVSKGRKNGATIISHR